MASIANYAALNGDNFIVGRSMGSFALGLYGRAYALMNLPLTYVSGILNKVLFPAFSEIRSTPDRLGRAYLMAVQLTSMVAAPLLFGMIVAAPHMILGLYGEKWVGAIAPLEVLCAAGFLRAVYHLGGSVARATGNVFAELRRQVVYAVLVIAGSLIGSRWGITGVSVGVATALAYMYLTMAQLALRLTGVGWRRFVRAQVPGVLLGAGAAGSAIVIRTILEWQSTPSIVIFGAIVACCAMSLSLGLFFLPRSVEMAALFGAISRATSWTPTPIRHSINRLLRIPTGM
jgi:PST family polysaccharide transporter